MYDNNQNSAIYQRFYEAKMKALNGSPLYEKDIDRIAELAAEKVLKKLSVSVDISKAVQQIDELNNAIANIGGK